MKLVSLIFTLLTVISLNTAFAQYCGYDRPEYWPSQVEAALTLLDHETVTGDTQKIKKGSKGLLQRIENDKLLVDFGRHGVHWLEESETNIKSLYGPNQRDTDALEYPNLTAQIGNKMVRFVERDAEHIVIADNANINYYISIYIGNVTTDTAIILQYIDQLQPQLDKDLPDTRCVVFAGANRWYGYFMTAFNRLPIMIPHMRLSYAAALHQEPETLPSLVVADAYGRIIHRSPQLRLDDNTNPKVRHNTRRSTRNAELKPVQRAFEDAFSAIQADKETFKKY